MANIILKFPDISTSPWLREGTPNWS